MHIAIFNDDALPTAKGGAAVVVQRLRKQYAKSGHQTTLITASDGHDMHKEEDEWGNIIHLPIATDERRRHGRSVSRQDHLHVVHDLLSHIRPDATHAHNLHNAFGYHTLEVAKAHSKNVILTAHDTFLVSFGRVNSTSYKNSVLQDKPHVMNACEHILASGKKYAPMRNAKIRSILRKSNVNVVAISHHLNDFLNANRIETDSVIYNGTDVRDPISDKEKTEFRKRHDIDGPYILFGGRLSVDKGFSALMNIAPVVHDRFPAANIVIAGDKKRVEREVQSIPIDLRRMLRFAGWLDGDEMRVAYAAARVTTTPSIYFDPFNLMNIEAMAESCPVVTSCFGGGRELIVHDETGFVVNPESETEYAEAIISLLEDEPLARQMGQSGRRHVLKNFTDKQQAERYLELLHR